MECIQTKNTGGGQKPETLLSTAISITWVGCIGAENLFTCCTESRRREVGLRGSSSSCSSSSDSNFPTLELEQELELILSLLRYLKKSPRSKLQTKVPDHLSLASISLSLSRIDSLLVYVVRETSGTQLANDQMYEAMGMGSFTYYIGVNFSRAGGLGL